MARRSLDLIEAMAAIAKAAHPITGRCWEIDALDPNVLRELVEEEIKSPIEWDAGRAAGERASFGRPVAAKSLSQSPAKSASLSRGLMALAAKRRAAGRRWPRLRRAMASIWR
jgi:hypothetical protein